jgi:hypothetical protein
MATSKKNEEVINVGVSDEDILFALEALRVSGMTDEIREKVNHIYRTIFKEEITYSCCKNRAYIKLEHYVRNVLKLR